MGFLLGGKLNHGDKLDLFLRYESTEFRIGPGSYYQGNQYTLYNFVNRKGDRVSCYGTTKKSISVADLEVGDCVEVLAKFAKYVTLRNGDEITQMNYVNITNNKGKKVLDIA